MTANTESSKRKLSLLQLAEEIGNVSKACQIMGYHRDTFYEGRPSFRSRKRRCRSKSRDHTPKTPVSGKY